MSHYAFEFGITSLLSTKQAQVAISLAANPARGNGHVHHLFGEIRIPLEGDVVGIRPWGCGVGILWLQRHEIMTAIAADIPNRTEFVNIAQRQRGLYAEQCVSEPTKRDSHRPIAPLSKVRVDWSLLATVGADITVQLQIRGREERWCGRIVRHIGMQIGHPNSTPRSRLIEIAVHGVPEFGPSIEFDSAQVLACHAFDPNTEEAKAIGEEQRVRLGVPKIAKVRP